MGRPTMFTDELALEICDRMAEGESLTTICRDAGMPTHSQVRLWARGRIASVPDSFAEDYAQARQDQADKYFDQVVDLADGAEEVAADAADEAYDAAPEGKKEKAARRVYHDEIHARRLRIDSRKWVLARMNRAKFGEKQIIGLEGGGKDAPPIEIKAPASLEELAEALRIVQEVVPDDDKSRE